MLRELVQWVLNNYLSNYVENLSVDQLSIAILQGEVELENVPLRKDALRRLGLPLEVRAGLIGRVRLRIPVHQIRAAPWLIQFEQLYLVAGPYKPDEWDAQQEEAARQEWKLRRLDSLEASWRARHQQPTDAGFYSSSCSSWLSYTSGLVANIVENLQLQVREIHIRYEDDTTLPGVSLAAGLTLGELSAQTCNYQWMPGYVSLSESAKDAFKLVDLKGAALYWDTNATMFGHLSLQDLAVAMKVSMRRPDSFVLDPVSAQAKLKRNRSEQQLRSRSQPRIICDLSLEAMNLTLTDVQYGQIVGLARGLEQLSQQREAQLSQSSCPSHMELSATWRWAAYRALTLSRVSALYRDLYVQYLQSPNSLPADLKSLKDVIEVRYCYEALREVREAAMQVAAQHTRDSATASSGAGRGLLLQWFPLWSGWYASTPAQQLRSPNEEEEGLEQELLQALKESQVQEDSPLTRDAVLAVTSMTLQRGSLRLIASDRPANHPVAEEDETEQRAKSSGHAVLELELEQLTMKAELRPRFNSRCFSFSVGGVYLKDCITRNSLYPMVIEPQQHRDGWQRTASASVRSPEPLFTLLFEVRPLGMKVDYRLHVESRSLAIVYNPSVVQAVADFFAHGHTTSHNPAWRKRYENMKRKTKERILQNWEQMLEGDQRERTKWDLKLNVSAPQILFAESFCDKSATVVLIDFGKLNVRNIHDGINIVVSPPRQPSEEDDECFHTPCSSPQTECKSPSVVTPKHDLSESALHQKMYDRFSIELGDMQILVGRTRDNLKHAHHKGTSTLHVLDRFNISIMLESRALYSNDPNLPSLKFSGSLPKLVVHINEQKVAAIRSMIHHMQGEGLPSPFRTQDFSPVHQADVEATQEARTVNESANLLVLRFCIDDMSLEVQSRGRPVAELQVRGVRAGLIQRPYETSASLSVHSLLLVDAMQTYGNDFDLLVASHQRVGMDSISGSLRDSEPTSPTSPISSPDPSRGRSTSPLALSQALRSLQARAASPPPLDILEPPDMEALIYVEILSLGQGCPSLEPGETSRHVATVNCNCLDLIANQETVVELVGFVHRLFPESKSVGGKFMAGSSIDNLTAEPMAKIELIFEFQRLNVLLLRAIIKDNKTQARKIATATLTEAKIQATVGNDLVIKGSLGGVQVLDLTPEGQKHQRILSLGHDPLVCSHHSELLHRLTAELSSMYIHSASPAGCRQTTEDEVEAFCFSFTRPLDDTASTEINLRMASVWYTHSPHFLSELQSCATEFKQYVSSLARSIRQAATDMAMGLVHARSEAMAERLYSSRGSLAGLDMSPQRRRRRSISQSLEFLENKFNTPYSPDEDVSSTDMIMDMKVDIVLESPVIVLPRSQTSNDVFVAHLGKITLNDHQNPELPSTAVSPDSDSQGHYCWGMVRRRAKYELEVRNMSLASLNVSGRQSSEVQRADVLYSCATDATPILHDTLLKLSLELERGRCVMRPTSESLPSLLMDQSLDFLDVDSQDVVQVRGCVVRSLQVSLSRFQYEQLLDCVDLLTSGIENVPPTPDPNVGFSLDPSLRTRLLGAQPLPATTPVDHRPTKHKFVLGVLFELPELRVTLRDNLRNSEQDKVLVSFGDFVVKYDKSDPYETSIKMSLRSLVVEDLSQPEDSAHRKLVVSQFLSEEELLDVRNVPLYASRSCPDVSTNLGSFKKRGSLPDVLETSVLYGMGYKPNQTQPTQMFQPSGEYPVTPPPSPRRTGSPKDQMARKDNLVHIDVLLIDPKSPDFFSKYNTNQRYVDVNFNCLDVIVNIESWVLILDFFGITEQQQPVKEATPRKPKIITSTPSTGIKLEETTNLEIDFKVRSLTLVLARVSGGELARANVAQLTARIEKRGSESVISGKLGKLSLTDLTSHGRLYRERFTTTGGLDFNIKNYSKPDPSMTREFDTQVNLRMCSVHYVHTQRFIEELKTQFTHFSFLQTFVSKLRAATAEFEGGENFTRGRRILWDIQTASPVILLPLSSRSNQVLVANLGELTVTNKFQLKIHENSSCLIDVMSIDLINMNIYSGLRITSLEPHSEVLHLGIGTYIEKISDTFLNEKCHLQLKVERNLDSLTCHPVADISSHGTLSTLHAVLSVEEYKLIRGFLAQNLGENLDDIEDLLPVQSGPTKVDSQYQLDLVWVLNCLKLDLHNVAVDLKDAEKEPLACINFIKCRLVIESRSDGSRDIDLVSKEILISDTRFINQPVNKRTNVFTNILQPVDITKRSSQVQAEIHHRRRIDGAQFTILLNNMRLMLVLDWWELVREFIWTEPENCEVPPTTKPMTVVEPDETPYELKLNVTDSEIVIVEDTSQSDTNAVILKSTTVVTYRPNLKERPLSCNLNRCELFYCILGLEEDTALSIVDPVTVNMEILQRENNTMGLEVSLQHMSLRLSYHDFRMFSKMLVSLPKQTKGARKQSVSDKSKEKPVNVINQINKLQGLGFSAENCAVALDKCKGKLDDAALWLTQHAPHMEPASPQHTEEPSGSSCFNIEGIEVKADIVSVCLIDDCRDSDVPFLEFSLVKLCLCQELNPHDPARYFDKGSMRSLMTTDYYNRHLSGWEPLIEPWKCDFAWENPRTTPVFQLSISSKELLCINITNSLLQLFQTVKESWTEDYLAITRSRADSQGFRRRSPFVPFEIHNDTGSDLWFTTNVKLADHFNSVSQDPANSEVWKFVAKGETQPFSFQTQRLKLRHRHTHEMKLHQVKVRIEGWQTISPVSIDKVGCYFRFAQPDLANKDGNVPSARVVFQVTTEGTAKKLITVRSALLITNQLTCPINLSMDNRGFNHNAFEDYVILPNKTYSVPLPLVHSTLRVIPMTENQSYQSSSNALQWYHVTEPGMVKEDLYCCRPSNAHSGEYGFRFTLAVRREMYPSEAKQYHNWQEHRQLTYMYPQPAHSLTILSPIVVDNLLPSELECSVGLQTLRISPGKVASINLIDISQSISLRFLIENFTSPGQLELQSYGGSTKLSNVLLTDQQGRALQLLAKVTVKPGKGISIAVSAPYWLLNRTGLPLVFKQEGASTDAAGQGSEHEMARMVTPLLFSLSDPDHGAGLVMRLGAGVHKGGRPEWCAPLLPRRDVQLRPLRVCTSDARSDHVYQIGISSKAGKGRYHRTTMIHFVPHFLLHNKSSFELQFAQSCLATTVADPGAQATFLRAVPGCCLPFHWPKLDRDQRLCVLLLDVVDCMWSGAFSINRSDLFHLNIRDRNGGMNFILVEVSQKDASFMVTFSDAATLPPPVRVDNFAEVPIAFHQVGIRGQQSTVRPHCSIPYAWDEPGQAKRIAFTAPGGNEAVFDFSILKGQEDLTYENFIYLALTWTFPPPGSCPAEELRGQQLVLAVPEGENRVVLQRKEAGCRAQLWRMTANGQLGHEGTSPPRDPRREPAPQNALVLDISGVAPQPSQYVPLVVRKPDPRRQSTQTWRFTEEGRLCCVHNNMCVQAKDGFFGLRKGLDLLQQPRSIRGAEHVAVSSSSTSASTWQMWSEVVLGPPQPTCHQRTESGVPVEQAVSRQRLRPGSGILRLRHIADGPTRVLEITDKTAKNNFAVMQHRDWSHFTPPELQLEPPRVLQGLQQNVPSQSISPSAAWEVRITLEAGVGASLVDTVAREELAFCLLRGFSSRFAVDRAGVQKLVVTILDVQVDNQMFEAQCPVVVYVPKMDREIAAFDPVIDIVAVRSTSGHHNIDTVQELVVVIRSMNITIEEEQLLRVVSVLGLGAPEAEPDSTATAARAEEYDTPHIGHASACTEGVSRYFVTELCIKPEQIRLGAVPCSKLPPGLNQLRRRLGLTLIKFEDAAVDLQPLKLEHTLLSHNTLLEFISRHFQQALRTQLPVIIFSADLLGGPAGLLTNVSDGVIDVLNDPGVRSVGDLVKNVTHGISNSAAKVTGSLSDGISRVALDESHNERRLQIRRRPAGSSSGFEHIKFGIESFALGVFGGATSIFTQTYESVSVDGPPGLITGIGKGLVGTVMRPVTGALDLASAVASAVRDSSRGSRRGAPCRFRLPRCVVGPGGLLPVYSAKQSEGQQFLHQSNSNPYSEIFMAYETLRSVSEDLRVIVSSEAVRVFTCNQNGVTEVIKVHLGELINCRYVMDVAQNIHSLPHHYIELTEKVLNQTSGEMQTRRPQVRCDTEDIAKWVCQQINYAKGMYEERIRTLVSQPGVDD